MPTSTEPLAKLPLPGRGALVSRGRWLASRQGTHGPAACRTHHQADRRLLRLLRGDGVAASAAKRRTRANSQGATDLVLRGHLGAEQACPRTGSRRTSTRPDPSHGDAWFDSAINGLPTVVHANRRSPGSDNGTGEASHDAYRDAAGGHLVIETILDAFVFFLRCDPGLARRAPGTDDLAHFPLPARTPALATFAATSTKSIRPM
ncbi:hypothetical protein [Streptomyces sp. Tu102]|uniref:hypothetical protein n=1 Tax=Streptomyces TaxID=1883 RepID=UPI001BDC0B9D|nr:hypothetical protein [Streptomyces sp. Tu102]MBT1093523.1 hypothetical protein [Streptomyces sp. Tu102]